MMHSSKYVMMMSFSIALVGGSLVWGQATNPAPAPTAPATAPAAPATAPAAPASAPAAAATSGNTSVMLLKQGHSDSVRAKAARDLGQAGDISTIPALAGALSDPSVKVRREVVLALVQFHQTSVLAPLEQATKDVDDSVRMTAIHRRPAE